MSLTEPLMGTLPQAQRAAKTANLKFEEFAYDFKKQLGKWDRQYRITEKAQEAKDYATEQAQNVDRQFGIRQKARHATADFRLKLPAVCVHHLIMSWIISLGPIILLALNLMDKLIPVR